MGKISNNMERCGCNLTGFVATKVPITDAGCLEVTREEFLKAGEDTVEEEDLEGAKAFYVYDVDVWWDGGFTDTGAFEAVQELLNLVCNEDEGVVYARVDNYVD